MGLNREGELLNEKLFFRSQAIFFQVQHMCFHPVIKYLKMNNIKTNTPVAVPKNCHRAHTVLFILKKKGTDVICQIITIYYIVLSYQYPLMVTKDG